MRRSKILMELRMRRKKKKRGMTRKEMMKS
jgi:hypothetical protein